MDSDKKKRKERERAETNNLEYQTHTHLDVGLAPVDGDVNRLAGDGEQVQLAKPDVERRRVKRSVIAFHNHTGREGERG